MTKFSIIDNIIKDLTSKFFNELESYLRQNAQALGFQFKSATEWREFAKKRVSRVETEGSDKVEYYIDFDVNNRGKSTLLGITNEKKREFVIDENNRMRICIG